jgi:hypothetical protein
VTRRVNKHSANRNTDILHGYTRAHPNQGTNISLFVTILSHLLISVNQRLSALDCPQTHQQPTDKFVRAVTNVVSKRIVLFALQNNESSPINARILLKPRF